jgi:peptidoglycan/LPS O-acetylase OafA/YrhL
MYSTLLLSHSLLRYFILLALLAVIIKSLMGMMNKKPFGAWDNKLSLYLLIFTHLQLIVGLILYVISPWVKFGPTTMSDKITRYWTVEHIFGMLVAVALITIARVSAKRLQDAYAKHKKLFILNTVALVLIIVIITMGDRGLFSMSGG